MADGGPNQDAVRVEGGQLRVDARPAVLVAQLQSSGGDPYVTLRTDGGSLHRAVPANVRTGTYRLSDEVTVEAVRGSSFVAVEEGGQHLVASFGGEVVLKAGADGDRLALAPHEGVLVPVGGGEPRVISLADAGAEPELASMLDRVTDAMAGPDAAAPSAPEPEATPAAAASTPSAAPAPAPAAAAAAGAAAASGPRSPGKKGKKGKKARQRQAQQQRPTGAAGAKPTSATPAAAGAAAAGAAPKPSPTPEPVPEKAAGAEKTAPVKKAAAPKKAAGATKKKKQVGAAAGAGGRPRPDGDPPRNGRRALGVLLALVAVVAAVLVLTRGDDGKSDTASPDTTTTESETSSTSETSAPTETTTTEAPATTTTTEAPATTTTTARPTTTTTAAPVADYRFVPRSCVQSGNTITYTASLTNQAQATFDYVVRVRFVDQTGAEVATANASVNDVRPGQTREVRATGTANRDLRNSGASCEVTAVEATAS